MSSRISLQKTRATEIDPENTNNRSEIIVKHQGRSDLAAQQVDWTLQQTTKAGCISLENTNN